MKVSSSTQRRDSFHRKAKCYRPARCIKITQNFRIPFETEHQLIQIRLIEYSNFLRRNYIWRRERKAFLSPDSRTEILLSAIKKKKKLLSDFGSAQAIRECESARNTCSYLHFKAFLAHKHFA